LKPRPYVPALGFHRLTGLYDPLIRGWSAAAKMRRSVIDALALAPGMRLLELGAGPGRLAIQIKQRHPEVAIDALDIDASMIARGQRNATAAGVDVRFHAGDMTALGEHHGPYDRVYSTMTFHHLCPASKHRALASARRVLRAGGSFVVADFSRPRDVLQHALFRFIQQPLDGYVNTQPHRDGRYERAVRDTFATVHSAAVWKTVAGTIEMFVCTQ